MNNLNNVSDRLKFYCRASKITVVQFEKSINVANGYVNSIAKSIGVDKLSLIVDKYPNLNIEWLLLGTGSMTKDNKTITTNNMVDNSNNIKGYNNIIDQHKTIDTETTNIFRQIIRDKDNIIETLSNELKEKSQQISTLLSIIQNNK